MSMLDTIKTTVLPVWVKPLACALVVVAIWGHGYTHGLDHAYNKVAVASDKIIVKQGKVTTKVITKYVKVEKKQEEVKNAIQEKGNSYAIKFPDDKYTFNNYFVSLYDSSVSNTIPKVSSGDESASSGVEVPEALQVMTWNNYVGHYWETRALKCEDWADEQYEANVK